MLLRLIPALAVLIVFVGYATAEGLLPDALSGLHGPAHTPGDLS